jgi:hypothetical protein
VISDIFLELAKFGAVMTVAAIIVSILSIDNNWHRVFVRVCYFFTMGSCLASFISSK